MVRCIMLAQSEGLSRDMEVIATGADIKVPVGKETIGEMPVENAEHTETELLGALQRVVDESAAGHRKLDRTHPRQKIMQPFGLHDGRHEKEVLHQ